MKRLAIAFLGFVCIVVVLVAIAALMTTTKAAPRNTELPSNINYSVDPGQTLLLDSTEDLQQKPQAFFPWDGSLAVTLVECDVYENMQEAGIDSSNRFYRDNGPASGSKWKYIQCSLKIENIDATPEGEDGLFGIDVFHLMVAGGSSDFWDSTQPRQVEYFDGYIENATEKDCYRFKLPVGEERLLTIGFWVEECDCSKPMYICAGLWDGATKYRFYLPTQREG